MQKNNLDESGHWSEISRIWKQIGSPLRPVEQDVSFVTDEITSWVVVNGIPRALILGVTPELYNLPWPGGSELLAVDHTKTMIDVVWPGPRDAIICANWPTMPLKENSRDIILCDGGIHLMEYPGHLEKFVETLSLIISSGGLCIFRLFIPPERQENPVDVLEDLFALKITNLNILKLRLGMSLQENSDEGIQLSKIWNTLHAKAPDLNQLADQLGWSLEHLIAINTYRDSLNKYYFLTVDEVEQIFCRSPEKFKLEKTYIPDYELGERCPTVVFQRV